MGVGGEAQGMWDSAGLLRGGGRAWSQSDWKMGKEKPSPSGYGVNAHLLKNCGAARASAEQVVGWRGGGGGLRRCGRASRTLSPRLSVR